MRASHWQPSSPLDLIRPCPGVTTNNTDMPTYADLAFTSPDAIGETLDVKVASRKIFNGSESPLEKPGKVFVEILNAPQGFVIVGLRR